jgi:hypothetical protein
MKRVDDSSLKLGNSTVLLVKQSQLHREQIPGIHALNQEAFKCKHVFQEQAKVLLEMQEKLPPELRIQESADLRSKFPHLVRRLDLLSSDLSSTPSRSNKP